MSCWPTLSTETCLQLRWPEQIEIITIVEWYHTAYLSSSLNSVLQTLKSSESRISSVLILTSFPDSDGSFLLECLAWMCIKRFYNKAMKKCMQGSAYSIRIYTQGGILNLTNSHCGWKLNLSQKVLPKQRNRAPTTFATLKLSSKIN